jgi:hypothetical protein
MHYDWTTEGGALCFMFPYLRSSEEQHAAFVSYTAATFAQSGASVLWRPLGKEQYLQLDSVQRTLALLSGRRNVRRQWTDHNDTPGCDPSFVNLVLCIDVCSLSFLPSRAYNHSQQPLP